MKEEFANVRQETKEEFANARQEAKEFRQEMKEELKEVKYDLRLDKEKLQQVYESRDKVTVSFTRSWATASVFMAVLASMFTVGIVFASQL